MPRRLKLIVAYEGTAYAGWQSQAGGNTIQDHLEAAFQNLTGEKVRVHGAGRTDAGVHALGQCAHADVPARDWPGERWVHALNASLPATIRVERARYVPLSFHARFSATGKTYRYRIWNARVLSPMEIGRSWHVPLPLDLAALAETAAALHGTHDFAAFAANRGKPEASTVRTITGVRVRRAGASITIDFSGDGFLYKMVRLLVGALVRCGQGKMPPTRVRELLKSPASSIAAERSVAPAEGLILMRVRY